MAKLKIELIYGDCLQIMEEIPNNSVNLIYADPPFVPAKYKDKWASLEEYIYWMRVRAKEIHRILFNIGSFYLHCDWHVGHYLKVMLDEIFGHKNFRNEIIWCYTGPSKSIKNFPNKHDIIFRYSKSDEYVFNINLLRVPYKKSNLAVGYTALTGRKDDEYLLKLDKRGKLLEDWWADIATIGYKHKEILGYPTQKPEALLERIIKASSNEGDLVLDPFCGSGTTGAACKKLNRNFMGIDNNLEAIKISKERLGIR